jgi:hypothetical protein
MVLGVSITPDILVLLRERDFPSSVKGLGSDKDLRKEGFSLLPKPLEIRLLETRKNHLINPVLGCHTYVILFVWITHEQAVCSCVKT